jgi:hypothetical protein
MPRGAAFTLGAVDVERVGGCREGDGGAVVPVPLQI